MTAFAEALKAEFPEFEVSYETVENVRGPLEDAQKTVQKVVINVGVGLLTVLPIAERTVDVAGKAVDVADHAVEVVDKTIDTADKFEAFVKRWNVRLGKAVVIPEEGDRQVLRDTSVVDVLEAARSGGVDFSWGLGADGSPLREVEFFVDPGDCYVDRCFAFEFGSGGGFGGGVAVLYGESESV